jgi:mono/diheme cytochrome c family protein
MTQLKWSVMTVVIAISGCMEINPRAERIAALTGVAATGQSRYTASCADCHGADGKGTNKSVVGGLTISLVKTRKVHTTPESLTYLLDGIAGTTMEGYSSWTDQQLADVWAYVTSLPE